MTHDKRSTRRLALITAWHSPWFRSFAAGLHFIEGGDKTSRSVELSGGATWYTYNLVYLIEHKPTPRVSGDVIMSQLFDLFRLTGYLIPLLTEFLLNALDLLFHLLFRVLEGLARCSIVRIRKVELGEEGAAAGA